MSIYRLLVAIEFSLIVINWKQSIKLQIFRHCADIYLQGYMSAQCPHNLEYRLTDRFENPVIADTLVTCDDVSVVELRDGGHVPDGGQDVEQGLLHSTS